MSKASLSLDVEEFRGSSGDWEASEDPNDWHRVWTEWFELKALSGQEREQAEQMQSTTSHTAISAFFPGTHSRMRLRNGSRLFNVRSVVNVDEANRTLEWRLVEVT